MNDWTNGISTLYRADAREIPLPDASVHMVVTSPPYWGLRDYGLGQWEGGDAECGHAMVTIKSNTSTMTGGAHNGNSMGSKQGWPNNTCGHCGAVATPAGIGLESTLGEWVANIVAVMREVRRVLRDEGTVWLNLGDAYSTSGTRGYEGGTLGTRVGRENGYRAAPLDLPIKNLMGQPWRVAFALQDDGWILRSAIVWHKPNPMPESATDRPTSAYEMVFLLSKEGRYFYDAEALKTAAFPRWGKHSAEKYKDIKGPTATGLHSDGYERPTSANARNVWTFPTQGRPDAHFATFPDELPRRCILAGTSEHGVCGECGAPWARVVESEVVKNRPSAGEDPRSRNEDKLSVGRGHGGHRGNNLQTSTQTLGWQPTCGCNADTVPATVLDPFVGSGTTVAIAQSLGRRGVGLDLNSEYLENAAKRIGAVTLPLIAKGELL